MKIKMNKTTLGSPNGFLVKKYHLEQEYELPESLVNVFLEMGVADKVVEKKMEKVPLNKSISNDMKEDKKRKKQEDKERQEQEDNKKRMIDDSRKKSIERWE